MPNTPVAMIDTQAVSENLNLVRQKAPDSMIMAVVKANAYGHGYELLDRGMDDADAFGVARVEEALELRQMGVDKPITVLEGFLDTEELGALLHYDLSAVFHSMYQFEKIKSLIDYPPIKAWIKVDTGMNRLGLNEREFREVMSNPGDRLRIEGIMTHFAKADEPDDDMNLRQLEAFDNLVADFNYPTSMANSAAVLTLPDSHRDWVRPGIMLYGANPLASGEGQKELRTVMTLLAPVIAVKEVRKGESVGYGGDWIAHEDTRIAVISIGYGDGYPREMPAGSPVLINGERRRIVGRVSMDMTCVELEANDRVQVGTMATMWGQGLPVVELAARVNTIPYTLLTGLTSRVKRSRGQA